MSQDEEAAPNRHSPPPGFTVSRDARSLRIDLRWGTWARLRMTSFVMLGICGLSVAVTLLLHGLGWIDPRIAAAINAAVLGAALGVGALLVTSRTTMRVEDGAIRVRHRRYLFPVHRTHGIDGLAQLFTIRVRGHDGPRTFYRFHLVALGRDGRKSILVPGLRLREQALFLERTVESHLGIVDRPVRGELRRVAPRFKPSPRDAAGKRPSFRFGLIMKQFLSPPRLSRRGRFVRDIRFMFTGREFRPRIGRDKPREDED